MVGHVHFGGVDDGDREISVLLVDDHEMVAAGLSAALGQEPDLRMVGWAPTLADGISKYDELRPDVVLMDYRLPDGDGAAGAAQIRSLDTDACVLLVTAAIDSMVVAAALDAGCSGFVGKDRGVDELAHAIRAAARGAAVFPADLLVAVTRPGPPRSQVGGDLTDREREVLGLLAQGRGTDEIASELFLSLHTVRNHVRNLLMKLQAHTKLEAVVVAAREGLIDLRASG